MEAGSAHTSYSSIIGSEVSVVKIHILQHCFFFVPYWRFLIRPCAWESSYSFLCLNATASVSLGTPVCIC
jgi:hypothetical protein